MDLDLGDCHIRKVVELAGMPISSRGLFPNCTAADLAHGRRHFGHRFIHPSEDFLYLDFHSFVVRTPTLTVLVDACNGNDKSRHGAYAFADRMSSAYLENLDAIGVARNDIDLVFCTHLHGDHVGWNTCLEGGEWVPTFPRARYLMDRTEVAHTQQLFETQQDYPGIGSFADSVQPILDSGLAELIDLDAAGLELGNGLSIEPARGHTAGNTILYATGRKRKAAFSGDIIHHPLQALNPLLHIPEEFDHDLATKTRIALLEQCADENQLLLPAHFAAPTMARVSRRGDAFDLEFAE